MKKMWVNADWVVSPDAATIEVIDPATEEVLEEVLRGSAQDVDRAVAAARRAIDGWRQTPATERAALLHEVAAKAREHRDELVRLLTLEEGKPIPENEEELSWTASTFDYYAELGRHDRGRVIPPGDPDQFNFVLKVPYGVVGCIVPWNYPLLQPSAFIDQMEPGPA